MELRLSLGDEFLGNNNTNKKQKSFNNGGLNLCIDLGLNSYQEKEKTHLDLLPRRLPTNLWSSDNGSSENGSSGNIGLTAAPSLDVNRPASPANSVGSTFYSMYRNGNNRRDFDATENDAVEADRTASEDDENALNTRKKLRLSKEQSAFLEESFKEHSTLNPKQKLALAKQLNLRPRQVEVWFQNRRARTKLKQTEVDCEYLKRCCETLTEDNRRLQKELQELRALKNSNPYYMQSPATTLTMCPSCERVATTSPPSAAVNGKTKGGSYALTRPRFHPFSETTTHHNPS